MITMNSAKRSIFAAILLISTLLAETGYNTIYLMEFENIKNDFTLNQLREALPDLIKENYSFRNDISVDYAGDIRPYLEPQVWTEEEPIKGMLINGHYYASDEKIHVIFEAFDIHSWKRLVKREIFCPVNDVICLHDGFLIAIESSISPFLADNLDIDATAEALKEKPKIKKKLDVNNRNDKSLGSNSLAEPDELEGAAEFHLDLDDGIGQQGQYGNRYYREFSLSELTPDDPYPSFEKNTARLIAILDQILINPYDVTIGEIMVKPDDVKPTIIYGNIPIEYSVKNALVQDLLTQLPHDKIINEDGNVLMQFSNNNFIFDSGLVEKLALMNYQLMPVIFFNNRRGALQFIILDSWNDKYHRLESKGTPVLHQSKFTPLFAITPGSDNIQFNMDVSAITVLYEFQIPYEIIGNYTKVTVKFMRESELEKLLTGNL